MVALALLMMLAVFAALFLTSSRFDSEAATADLDAIRMDLYAEGMFQYMQNCMALGLWGFDDVPLNYDGNPTPPSGQAAATAQPGPDTPFDYFGRQVLIDPDGSTAAATPVLSGDEYYYYPNFWLTDPRVQLLPYTISPPTNQYQYTHAALTPAGLPPLTLGVTAQPTLPPFFDATYSANVINQWRFADLDGDGRADTPWLFQKRLGNGLYLRAAIRVEDTSSRINVNVANRPIFVDGSTGVANPFPFALSEVENLLRDSLYSGYPYLGNTTPPVTPPSSRFPILTNANPIQNLTWEDQTGRFLSETNLLGAVATWAQQSGLDPVPANAILRALYLNNSNGALPGRFGVTPNSVPGVLCPNNGTVATGNAVPPALASLLGDPVHGDAGRLGRAIEAAYATPFDATAVPPLTPYPWDFDAKPTADHTRWRTFDPDAVARRLTNQQLLQGRPFTPEETFDLLSAHGLTLGNSAYGEIRYRSGGSLPMTTRLEGLWSFLQTGTNTATVQWRRLLTGYSWSLNLCPFGEHPYAADAANLPVEAYRKLDLNDPACTDVEFGRALGAAYRHAYGTPPFDQAVMDRLTANFLAYRITPMNAVQLATFLLHKKNDPSIINPPANVPWNPVVWSARLTALAVPDEATYLTDLFDTKWNTANHSQFWTEIDVLLAAGISTNTDPAGKVLLPQVVNDRFSYCRHPFITEVYANIRFNTKDDSAIPPTRGVAEPYDPAKVGQAAFANDYAIELYNPWDTAISLDNWEVQVTGSEPPATVYTVSLAGHVIPPLSRAVVTRFGGFAPAGVVEIAVTPSGGTPAGNDLVLATQAVNATGPQIQLIYTSAGQTAIYDEVPGEWTKEFNADRIGPWDIVRRDDNGFWCYQRWAVQYSPARAIIASLGSPNSWNNPLGQPMLWDPWPVDPYNLGGYTEGFGPNPAVPRLNGGLFLSPAELALLPYNIPATDMTLAEAITPYARTTDPYRGMPGGLDPRDATAGNPATAATCEDSYTRLKFVCPMLFNRGYTQGMPNRAANAIADQATNRYSGVMQSLMDFVTVLDFPNDNVDSSGSGVVPARDIRVPGRLNLNTVADWYSLEQLDGLLLNVPSSIALGGAPADNGFWRRLFDYRDKIDPYQNLPTWNSTSWFKGISGRRTKTGNILTLRDAINANGWDSGAFLGFEQLAEVCNVQESGLTYQGFWQNPVQGAIYGLQTGNAGRYDPLLPQQYMRKFARNMNSLNTRSDTYMVTIRVEIVRPLPMLNYVDDPAGTLTSLSKIEVLGQKEFMYLTDRSYCLEAPQRKDAVSGAWRLNLDYIPPKVWRMAIPKDVAHGG